MNDAKKAKQRAALAVHKVKKFASTNVKDLYDKIGSQTLKIKALEDNELSLNNKIDSLEEKTNAMQLDIEALKTKVGV